MLRERHSEHPDREESDRTGSQEVTRPRTSERSKRLLDVVAGSILLVVMAPLFAILALAVKLETPGPAFFSQLRAGVRRRRTADGKMRWERATFTCYKFRTMHNGADQKAHHDHVTAWARGTLETLGREGAEYKIAADPRVTKVGRILRRTSVDELPQLINVVKGEMSLVGPRPVPEYEVAEYKPEHFERLQARPGITGYWQVYGRGRVTFEEMMAMDIWYVRNRTFLLDLKLLLMTVPAVLSGRGAD